MALDHDLIDERISAVMVELERLKSFNIKVKKGRAAYDDLALELPDEFKASLLSQFGVIKTNILAKLQELNAVLPEV